jgi:hypothetical protein
MELFELIQPSYFGYTLFESKNVTDRLGELLHFWA